MESVANLHQQSIAASQKSHAVIQEIAEWEHQTTPAEHQSSDKGLRAP